ncbi:cell division protein [Reichenbachiella sp. 5M10]|uniref:SRPBCC family protein n=1 Tax=Reichenbachiella sp. 5M10 TaxID=1889772 RepID=UPI000C149ACE|nr:SRPBCC family protein [Reichenbachiella sp. 5M10]PIB35266.1 cell division protein [Reichenbachiella sp. 5M10]
MPKIELHTLIEAPIERCFDLSRSIDLHKVSTQHTQEKAVAGITTGLINTGETVTWEARHFGVVQRMTTLIPELERPAYFVSLMQEGAFQFFRHVHSFEIQDRSTLMTDHIEFKSPYGVIGRLVDRLILRRYLVHLLSRRNATIKRCAESDEWKFYL